MTKTLTALLFLLVVAAGAAFGQAGIKNSKHDMSAGSTSSIKSQPTGSGGTSEICVFCHTPHGSSNIAPLWNRTSSLTAYTLYTSDYLGPSAAGGLGYLTASPAAQPNASSKLCLSCHDGTIALGSVYNLPGSGGYSATPGPGILMQSAGVPIVGGKMPATAGGNLGGAGGADLSNDHPVGFLYNSTVDTELTPQTWASNSLVRLYPNGDAGGGVSVGRLECATCHNAHDNQYYNFLRIANTNAALCTFCHNKVGFIGSAHNSGAATTASYTPKGRPATNVAEWSCRSCHRPHNSTGQNLQSEQNSCYEKGCHGANTTISDPTNAVTPGFRLIQPEMGKAHAHPADATSGAHKNRIRDATLGVYAETQAELGVRHAECPDCHNPHKVPPNPVVAKAGRGTLRISAALTGTWGVQPTWPTPTVPTTNAVTNLPVPTIFTRVAGATLTDEYQVCFKCHSGYANGLLRDIASEANPQYSSYHGIVPLVGAATAIVVATQQNNATNFFVNTQTMAAPWAGSNVVTSATTPNAESCRVTHTQANCVSFAASRGRVWCSDCHNNNSAPLYPSAKSTTVPSGPHGSSNIGTTAAPSNSDKMLIATLVTTNGATPLCLRCHLSTTYTGNSNSRNNQTHSAGYRGLTTGCLSCHMWDRSTGTYVGTGKIYPHGMNKRWVNVTGTATLGTGQMVDSFIAGYQSNINYSLKTCTTESGCSRTNQGY